MVGGRRFGSQRSETTNQLTKTAGCTRAFSQLIMAYLTMEADIDHGRVIPKEPEKLPATGKALLTVLGARERKPDWDKVMRLLGTMQCQADGLGLERQARAEWNKRDHFPRQTS